MCQASIKPSTVSGFVILILIGFSAIASAQRFDPAQRPLPPEILVAKYLIHAEQLHTAKDYAGAFEVMQEIVALQNEHSLAVPDDFHFNYARVALSADSMRTVLESVTRYLSATGEEGKFYEKALTLLLKDEENEVTSPEDFYENVIKTQETCEGLPDRSECWMALTNHHECYVWNRNFRQGDSAIWTGKCSGHVPDGEGTITWFFIDRTGGKGKSSTEVERELKRDTGLFQNGKKHGKWTKRSQYSEGGRMGDHLSMVTVATYKNGTLHGQWVNRLLVRTVLSEDAFDDGKKDGPSDTTYV